MKQHSLFGAEDTPEQEPRRGGDIDGSPVVSRSPLRLLSFDIEATGRDPLSDTAVGIALCKEKGAAYYVPLRHTTGPNLDGAVELLKPVLEDPALPKVGHNLKYDILILRREGIQVRGDLYDTMVASYLLNPGKPGHSLEETAVEYLMHRKRPFAEVLGKRGSFADVPLDEATAYAAEDAELALELREILFAKLEEQGLDRLYRDIEMPLIYVLADMEETGVKIDRGRLEALSKELDLKLQEIQTRIYALAGTTFNINSPRQLCKVLFEDMGLKPLKRTKTGYSTGMEVLEELAKSHELPGEILNYRTLYKLKTTYADALPALINERTGRVHTSFNQTVTATGRLSSSDPNLQNIPIRGEWGTRIREAFVAEEGHTLISADYSQIELRLLAHMSGDAGLIGAFRENVDIHARTAAELFRVPLTAVNPELRRIAKVVNFGIIYGMSAFGLSESLGISPKEAGSYIDQYFDKHPGVRRFIEETIATARQQGYVTTVLGRIRPLPDINSATAAVRQQAERLATNTPVQGTAADLIKKAMVSLRRRLRERGLAARMILQIHDELLFEVPEGEIDEARELIRHEMEQALSLSVPLKVDIGLGKNWAEAH